MKKEILLFFFGKTGKAPEKQLNDDEELFFGYPLQIAKAAKNKKSVFFTAKRMISRCAYRAIKTLMSDICIAAERTFGTKNPDEGLKMSLQYIGNVYRFVKSMNLTLR